MFKGLGELASLMKNAKEMQGRVGEVQEHLARMRIKGSSGGGMVMVEVNGKQDVLDCRIDAALFESGDREMLEKLMISAMNDALSRSRQAGAEAMQEAAGLNLPGMQEAMAKFGLAPGT